MYRYLIFSVFLLALAGCDSSGKQHSAEKVVKGDKGKISSLFKVYVSKDTFANTLFNLKEALKDKGIKINNIAHISAMLKRTGKDLGRTKVIFGKAENVEFCNAILSRNTMEVNPGNIIYCPYIISVYTLPGNAKKTYVAYRRLPRLKDKKSDAALQAVEKLLDGLAREATQ